MLWRWPRRLLSQLSERVPRHQVSASRFDISVVSNQNSEAELAVLDSSAVRTAYEDCRARSGVDPPPVEELTEELLSAMTDVLDCDVAPHMNFLLCGGRAETRCCARHPRDGLEDARDWVWGEIVADQTCWHLELEEPSLFLPGESKGRSASVGSLSRWTGTEPEEATTESIRGGKRQPRRR